MKLLRALCIAFTTYSRVPMPQVEWSAEHMRHSLCFFPLVGVLIGALELGWLMLCKALGLGALLKGAVGCLIPLAVSGGIHMDGFMDTADALASGKPPEDARKILKDPHAGAFAAMSCAMYLVLMTAVLSEANASIVPIAFVLSRSLSALSLVTMKSASEGLVKAFSDSAARKTVRIWMTIWIGLFGSLSLWLDPLCGFAGLCVGGICYALYWRVSMRRFEGITGDLAGWFLQVCELCYTAAVVILRRCL